MDNLFKLGINGTKVFLLYLRSAVSYLCLLTHGFLTMIPLVITLQCVVFRSGLNLSICQQF